MKKITFFSAMAISAAMSMSAATALRVTLVDGTAQNFVLEERPVVTFPGQNMLIKTSDFETTVERYDIKSMDFIDEVTGIEDIAEGEKIISYLNGIVTAEGMIYLYDMSGRQRLAGNGSLDTTTLPSGVYVVRTINQSLKIVKK